MELCLEFTTGDFSAVNGHEKVCEDSCLCG